MPIAMPMSARLSAGASFTPSPVIATMWPLRLRMSTRRTLSSGVTRAITPMPSIASSASSSLIAANSAPVMARPSIPSLRAIASAVTAWSPVIIRTSMPAAVGLGDRRLRLRARRVDDADEREQRQAVDQREQVGVRVERRRVEVLARGREHAQALLAEPLVLGHGSARRPSSSTGDGLEVGAERVACRARAAGRARPSRTQRTTSRPDSSCHAVERRHQLVGGVERELGDARVRARGSSSASRPPFSASTTSAPSVGSPISSPSRDHRVRGEQPSAAGTGRAERPAAPATRLIVALGRVAAAGDRVPPPGQRQLDRRHLVQRQRPGLVRVDRRRRAERLGRAEPLHDRVRLREHLRAEREDRRHDRRQPGRDRRDRRRRSPR